VPGGDRLSSATSPTPSAPSSPGHDVSPRAAALVAAVGLLVMAVVSPAAYFGIFPSLIDRADVAHTIANVTAHQGRFLLGVVCYLLTFLSDIVVAWALYVFLRPAGAALAMLAAWIRVVYAAMALASLPGLVTVLRLIRTGADATTPAPLLNAEVQLTLNAFRWSWGFALLVFAAYLVLLGIVVARSRYVPGWLGVLLVVNGCAYAVDSLRPYLFPAVSLPFLPVFFFGELLFMAWLFGWGWRVEFPPPR